MKKYLFDIQLFAEDGAEGGAEGAPAAEPAGGEHKGAAGKPAAEQPKYTDADIDRIIGEKFAKWKKQQEQEISEAERLSKMTAEEKAAEKLKDLEGRIAAYEKAEARSAMTKQARGMLQDKGIHVGDELLANLIAENAEGTKAAVESFINLFTVAVEKAVKEKVKGEAPKAGSPTGSITKEQILAITNRAERQRLMAENSNLF